MRDVHTLYPQFTLGGKVKREFDQWSDDIVRPGVLITSALFARPRSLEDPLHLPPYVFEVDIGETGSRFAKGAIIKILFAEFCVGSNKALQTS